MSHEFSFIIKSYLVYEFLVSQKKKKMFMSFYVWVLVSSQSRSPSSIRRTGEVKSRVYINVLLYSNMLESINKINECFE